MCHRKAKRLLRENPDFSEFLFKSTGHFQPIYAPNSVGPSYTMSDDTNMSLPRLRVFCDDEGSCGVSVVPPDAAPRETVTVPLGEVLPLLADAVRNRRTWLRDFQDDEVTLSADLYEVLLAYLHLYRPSA